MILLITKRDGRVEPFDKNKIVTAIEKCFNAVYGDKERNHTAEEITVKVVKQLEEVYTQPTVEQVQDEVEHVLMQFDEYEAARAYITYRNERAGIRKNTFVPKEVRERFDADKEYFPTALQQFQFYDKYSRFNYDLQRRETWIETVDRAVEFLQYLVQENAPEKAFDEVPWERIRSFILEMKATPSMRLLAMAGPAAERNNITIYNCSAVAVNSIDAFVEALIISMSGCGVGFSVERQFVNQLPTIAHQSKEQDTLFYKVPDTAEGWAQALRMGLECWFNGNNIVYDYSDIRPHGAPLKTKGGRASGPEPLRFLLDKCKRIILSRQGRKLRPLDAHDMMCSIGGAAVSGGVRRSAMISLFDFDDVDMRLCKSGSNLDGNEQRWNANNSVVITEEMSQQDVIELMLDMIQSQRGEPGIFSRYAIERTLPERREHRVFLTNPCAEILLRDQEFCNLSIAVARKDDTIETLKEKVEVATIIGTIQSLATHFPGLRDTWKQNCEEERLLGVDITGQYDTNILNSITFTLFKDVSISTNKYYAEIFGINPSVAITCVKPSGNSSTLFDCASGIHPRHAPYYIRNVRLSASSPLYKVLKEAGVSMVPENGQTVHNATTWVVPFPVKAPEDSETRNTVSALEHCEWWKINKLYWTEHNPSVTITYRPNEILYLIEWVYLNQDIIGGMSFLPSFDIKYNNMPYMEITEEEYNRLMEEFPVIDYSNLYRFEDHDLTEAAQTLACFAGTCDL